ncbi:MAG: dimethyl sulfoxide reductase anchor subunit [Candidatus Omnitrophica bacterium]|nr:dimethyl sulfoxide reductase anchor subunit [Candidatus Omnitrophota bacterium]
MTHELTAVENFSLQQDLRQIAEGRKVYKELIPKTTPGPGQQYAFEVNLDQCSGCKACVAACHSENGLDEDETWRSVGLLQGGGDENPTIQHITSACHHCLEPACMSGCPTKAYEKDPTTGIVKHLDDQCFGCQYCILKCPYDVPKYNPKRGIVHKCDMCISRLNVGEAPACVRACPTSAIRITVIDQQKVRNRPQDFVNIPEAPDSRYTLPTTRYVSRQSLPSDMTSIDSYTVKPEHSHLPLVFMLVLTQLSVGSFGVELFLREYAPSSLSTLLFPFSVGMALGMGLLALAASVLHLGRPLYAFRAFLGFQTSWLSREIVAFGTFALLAAFYASALWVVPLRNKILSLGGGAGLTVLAISVFVSGFLGVLCSVMVYRDTQRPFWNHPITSWKFLMTTMILGVVNVLMASVVFSWMGSVISPTYIMETFGKDFCRVLIAAMAIKLLMEASIFSHLCQKKMTFFKKSALLMTRPLKRITQLRFFLGVAGGMILPAVFLNDSAMLPEEMKVMFAVAIFIFCLGGEILERYLFFRAVVPLKMPGGQAS